MELDDIYFNSSSLVVVVWSAELICATRQQMAPVEKERCTSGCSPTDVSIFRPNWSHRSVHTWRTRDAHAAADRKFTPRIKIRPPIARWQLFWYVGVSVYRAELRRRSLARNPFLLTINMQIAGLLVGRGDFYGRRTQIREIRGGPPIKPPRDRIRDSGNYSGRYGVLMVPVGFYEFINVVIIYGTTLGGCSFELKRFS